MTKDPLKVLIKSAKEIEGFNLPKIIIPNNKGIGRGKWRRQKGGNFAIIHSNMIIDGRYKTNKEARKFAIWNYKGRKDFSVIDITKLL